MSLTNKDKEIIVNTWTLVRTNIAEVGIELFKRFFQANPSYVKVFPFNDLTDLDDILKDPRLKIHAGRVMSALSSIVDNLNNPKVFEEHLNNIIASHVNRQIELSQFQNLKVSLVQLLIDHLGTEMMNDEAQQAWSKAYDVILDAYKKESLKQINNCS